MMYESHKWGLWRSMLIKYPPRIRYCITMLLCVGIVGFWYALLYLPVKQTIRHYEKINAQLHNQSLHIKQEQSTVDSLLLTIDSLEKDLVAYKSIRQSPNDIIGNMIQLAAKCSVFLDGCEADVIIDNQWCQILPISLTVRGSVDQITAYMQALAHENKLCRFAQLSMTAADGNTMRCQLVVHYLNLS